MRQKLLGIILLFSIVGCSSQNKVVKIEDRTRANTVSKGIHVVDQGESLHTIAFSYGRDYRNLAAINGIKYPYKILPGQKIYLNKTGYKPPVDPIKSRKNRKSNQQTHSIRAETNRKIDKYQLVKDIAWVWPVQGKLKNKFSEKDKFNKGIDIDVNTTMTVKAAADGEVVYNGTGLKGYGKLIIIKHSEDLLSAYANNDLFFVKEGQRVKKGQKIAMIGDGTKQLHFEIRKNGRPVNPLQYLPS